MTRIASTNLLCPYCFTPARLTDSSEVYNGRSYGPVYVCGRYPECDAYVGVHKGTGEPLGRLADARLRKAKVQAHKAFDPLWRNAPRMYDLPDDPQERKKAVTRIKGVARNRAYRWLAMKLGIRADDCHIGFMNIMECKRVAQVCRNASPEQIRQWAKEQGG